jgi:hypothetical protein
VDADLAQALTGSDAARAESVKACFEGKLAAAVPPEDIRAMNDFDQAVMSSVVLAINASARARKAEVAGQASASSRAVGKTSSAP